MKAFAIIFVVWLNFLALSAEETKPEPIKVPKPDLKTAPLNLEKIVIRGRAPRPLDIKALRPRSDLITPQVLPPIRPQAKESTFHFTESFKAGGGNFNSWLVSNQFHIKKHANNMGINFGHERSDGFRRGYANNNSHVKLEYQWLTPGKPTLSTSYAFSHESLDLPEPDTLFYRDRERREQVHEVKFKLQVPWPTRGEFETFFELRDANQHDSHREKFDDFLFRTGMIYRHSSWKTALSVESESRDLSRSLISRFYIQNTRHPISPNTSLHWGLGTYLFTHDNNFIDTNFFLLNNKQDEKKKGVVFSPFVQFDHVFDERLKVYASFSQFLETTDVVEAYFKYPELSRSNNFVNPSKHTAFETGLHHKTLSGWQYSITYRHVIYKDRPVFVEDLSTDNQKITTDIWDKGKDNIILLHMELPLAKYFRFNADAEFHEAHWKRPSVSFTPYESEDQLSFSLVASTQRFHTSFSYRYEEGRTSYPSFISIPSSSSFDFDANVKIREYWMLWGNVKNITNRNNVVIPGYPDKPRRFLLGFRFSL